MSDTVLIKFLLSSSLIVLSLLILYYIVNRFFPNYTLKKSGDIEVLSTLPLGKERGLILVRVRGKALLIGYDRERLHFLKEWNDEETDNNSCTSSPNSNSGKR